MLRTFEGITGHHLEAWFLDLFRNYMQLRYYPSPGQIALQKLDPSQQSGHHLELDGILLIHKTCILLEYTSQSEHYRSKIKKFTRNCNLYINSGYLTKREKFELFGIPDEDLDDFEDVEHFKYLFISTNNEFEQEHLTRVDFPDYPAIQRHLFIFKPTNLEYLRQLTNLINKYAQNEFYASLGFTPGDLGLENQSIHLDFIKADGKYISTNQNVKADIYLLKFNIKDLLDIARVSRYEGIPFILDQGNNESYQRFLIEQKLNNISSTFIVNNSRKCFPNTITLMLSNDCREEELAGRSKLTIPRRYSSIDIIDGQHRLFAYTRNSITDKVRERSEILASAIKFRSRPGQVVTNNSARVFCEINSNQSKVKNNLIYLIKYDVLGDTDEVAIAGKVILECNRGKSDLADMFFTNTLRKRNRLNLPAVPVTTIIDNDLVPFIKGIDVTTNQLISNQEFRKIFGNSRDYFVNGKESELIVAVKQILEKYFKLVAQIFCDDWKLNADSYLISAKYISAFIRLLRYKAFTDGFTVAGMKQVLIEIKDEIDAITEPNNTPSLPRGITLIPTTSHGIKTIFDFLLDTSSFEVPE